MGTRCEHCGGELPLLARRHARYCSGRCRTAACRARQVIPAALTSRPRWVRYSAGKVPLTVTGRPASPTDPAAWAPYAAARDAAVGVGVGFVLNGDGIACIDLDHCLAGGVLAGWAAGLLASLPATWTEVSPSGHGLHVWGRATVGTGRVIRRGDGACIEVYDRGRYVTVTGRRFGPARELADISAVVDGLR